jgi:hypothetical protein
MNRQRYSFKQICFGLARRNVALLCVAAGTLSLASPGSAAGFFNNPFPFHDDCKSAAYAALPRTPGLNITGTSIKMENNNLYSIGVRTQAGGRSANYQFLCSWANGNVKIVKRSVIR